MRRYRLHQTFFNIFLLRLTNMDLVKVFITNINVSCCILREQELAYWLTKIFANECNSLTNYLHQTRYHCPLISEVYYCKQYTIRKFLNYLFIIIIIVFFLKDNSILLNKLQKKIYWQSFFYCIFLYLIVFFYFFLPIDSAFYRRNYFCRWHTCS